MNALLISAGLILSLDVGVYHNLDIYPDNEHAWNNGDSPVAEFRLSLNKGNVSCSYAHVSNWLTGAPFNHERESTLDMVGCAYRFNLWKQK